ncbi:alpha/beta fold hydrolase [Kitasatospora sp. NPDC098663]|uniref:alpha/beta fold hydrolase n=1 Tax=Kitasatospora sp. NPDC098663 TaxID=3364096 RepID=UPI00381517C4
MPFVHANGIRISYQSAGDGEPVLLIMGSGAPGRVWTMHQTPALVRAGYRAVTFDNRGIAPTGAPAGRYSLDDMVRDTKGLIETLELGPCRVVGTSLGAMIAQELALTSPELVRCAVLIGTRARVDAFRRAYLLADRARQAEGIVIPPAYQAAVSVLEMLSPATRDNDAEVAHWLDLFELAGDDGAAPGQAWADPDDDRRAALRNVSVPCRVIAFADDVITPPHLCAEVADSIPDCDLVRIPSCGHIGYLERPGEVNSAIIEFLDKN